MSNSVNITEPLLKNMKERKEPLLCARNLYGDELYDYRNTYFGHAACSADLPYSANSSKNGLIVLIFLDCFSIDKYYRPDEKMILI